MADLINGKRLVKHTRDRGIIIRLIRDGKFVNWRGPVGAMTDQLEEELITNTADVEAYLRWEQDRVAPTTPMSQILEEALYEHRQL